MAADGAQNDCDGVSEQFDKELQDEIARLEKIGIPALIQANDWRYKEAAGMVGSAADPQNAVKTAAYYGRLVEQIEWAERSFHRTENDPAWQTPAGQNTAGLTLTHLHYRASELLRRLSQTAESPPFVNLPCLTSLPFRQLIDLKQQHLDELRAVLPVVSQIHGIALGMIEAQKPEIVGAGAPDPIDFSKIISAANNLAEAAVRYNGLQPSGHPIGKNAIKLVEGLYSLELLLNPKRLDFMDVGRLQQIRNHRLPDDGDVILIAVRQAVDRIMQEFGWTGLSQGSPAGMVMPSEGYSDEWPSHIADEIIKSLRWRTPEP